MNDLYTNVQNSTKAAIEFAEISTHAFTEIMNNQVGLLNEVLGASLNQAKKAQSAKDLGAVVEDGKNFSADLEAKTRKVASANMKVIEDTSKKAYELFAKSATNAASTTSSK